MKKNLPALRRPRHPTEGHNEGPRCPRGQASLHLNKRQGWRKEQNLAGLQSCYLLGRMRRTRPDRGRQLLKKPSRLNNQEHKHLKNTFILPCFHHQKTWEPPQVFVSKSKRIFSKMDWQSPREPEESLLLETAPFIFKFQHPSVLQPQLSNVNYFFIPIILVT